MGKISGSHVCHDMLSKQPIWWEFTFAELKALINSVGAPLTDGVITGFITRARRMGMIKVIGTAKQDDKRKPIFRYRYEKTVDWQFKSAGIGSHPGRVINGRKHDTAEELGALIMKADEQRESPIAAVERLGMEGITKEIEIDYDTRSLSDQLISLAIKVDALENRPVKTLSDYSTNDLIEELKTRVK